MSNPEHSLDIAIIGLNGRFPGADNVAEFWQNLKDGVESITFFSKEEDESLEGDWATLKSPQYVRAAPVLEKDIGLFDSAFFGFSPREAEIMDPQQRLFLESAWEVLESAGYDTETYKGRIGVYAGVSFSTYLMFYLSLPRGRVGLMESMHRVIRNDKDYLATTVSYKLNLKGPSVTVQTACSTSLVGVHFACQSLLNHECDLALAGGVRIILPQKSGYVYYPDGILSPDGHCRAFDADAQGTIFGNGLGIVVLKRLSDAVADGDCIHAVIKGSAINNDGSTKVGFTAPGFEGQKEVVSETLSMAAVPAETITYIETHGTGTPLGDPIEIAALTAAFGEHTAKKQFCAIGSVKTNIGHLEEAAGIASLIKTVMALKHRLLPPSLHFAHPNPRIDFANSPFYVNTSLSEWKTNGAPRRAGISSFGIGGTNAHVVLEEAPEMGSSGPSRPWQLLLLSAKTEPSLKEMTSNLARHLEAHPDLCLPDVAYTLQLGRRAFPRRRIVLAQSVSEAARALVTLDGHHVFTAVQGVANRPVAFMFPGQGAQYPNMTRALYEIEPVFRAQVDRCAEFLVPHLHLDLRRLLYPAAEPTEKDGMVLSQTAITQPALFVVDYALARLWMSWGVQPEVMIGHSLGEYVAACLADVFSLEDALKLVVARGRFMQQQPAGAMAAVNLPETDTRTILGSSLSLAAVNAPELCAVSGPTDSIRALEELLAARGVGCRRLQTSHAFHSEMMDPALNPFEAEARKVTLRPPRIPFVSNVTGQWITAADATDPRYWADHLRQTVRFGEGVRTLIHGSDRVLLEVGPGQTLASLARQQFREEELVVLSSTPRPQQQQSDLSVLLTTLGRLWLSGVQVDWSAYSAHERRYRVPLPSYPFQRRRYWIDRERHPDSTIPAPEPLGEPTARPARETPKSLGKQPDIADWFYRPAWKDAAISTASTDGDRPGCWLVFTDTSELSRQLIERMRERGNVVITVQAGDRFDRFDDQTYAIDPRRREDYDVLLEDVRNRHKLPAAVAHLWNVSQRENTLSSLFDEFEQYLGFYSLLFLTQAIAKRDVRESFYLGVVTSRMQKLNEEDTVCPSKATVLGPCLVIPLEYPNMRCCSVDIEVSPPDIDPSLVDLLLLELAAKGPDPVVAYRRNRRWVRAFDRVRLERPKEGSSRLRERGVYLITGGLGGLGLVFAEYLARTVHARLVLIGRTPLPSRADWEQWLATHEADDRTSQRLRTVQNLERLGAEVLTVQADVADYGQMQAGLDQATEQFGTLHGVIHAAGVIHDGLIAHKTYDAAASVLAPKVRGGLLLDALFRDTKLDFLVFFSSISAVTGRVGQVDYVAANAFLDALATARTGRNDRLTVSIDWDAWQEAGMAAEIATRLRASEKPQSSKAVRHPLLEESTEDSGRWSYRTRLRAAQHWVLDEHRIAGQAVLPGTGCLEMARAAFADHTGVSVMEIRNFAFTSPTIVADGQDKELRTVLEKDGNAFTVTIEAKSQFGQYRNVEWQPHAYGEIAGSDALQPGKFALSALETQCHGEWTIPDEARYRSSFKTTEIAFGPRWKSLKQIKWANQQGLAVLELPDAYASDVEAFGLHPALLDVALGWPALAVAGSVHLPLFYERVRIFGRIPKRLYSYARQRHSDGTPSELLTFDVTLIDEEGTAIIEVEGYNLRKVTDETLRLVAGAATSAAMDSTAPSGTPAIREDENLSLETANPGLLESLRWRTANRREPAEDEVEIEVYATGLNFLDVLSALGLRPGGSDDQMGLGCECAGRIVSVGPGIEEFQIGDEVIAVTPFAFSRFVTASRLLVAPKPARFSFEEAATIPIAFLTATYALYHVGRLQPGERVLIQAAAGGVGLAAVQLAQRIGAGIFATAGSEKKRAFLRSLGITHVMDSRSLAFADEVMATTNGQGVDAVLNSLAGEFIPKGLSTLSSFGRFLEIGKRDIYQGSDLNLLPFAKNLSFCAIDLLRVAFERPEFLNRLLREVMQYFEDGTLRPLPFETFSFTRVAEAFEHMAGSRQIGKVVILRPDTTELAALGSTAGSRINIVNRRRTGASVLRSPRDTFNPVEMELKQGILPGEGLDAFERIFNHSWPQVAVSTRDLSARISQTAGQALDLLELSVPAASRHPRPALDTPYVAPRNELEAAISEIWKTHLGIESVGVHDNFFELGGDSLLAVQVVARVSKRLQVDVPLSSLWEVQTVAGVAEALRQREPRLAEAGAMASLIEPSDAILSPAHPLAGGSSDEKEEGVI